MTRFAITPNLLLLSRAASNSLISSAVLASAFLIFSLSNCPTGGAHADVEEALSLLQTTDDIHDKLSSAEQVPLAPVVAAGRDAYFEGSL